MNYLIELGQVDDETITSFRNVVTLRELMDKAGYVVDDAVQRKIDEIMRYLTNDDNVNQMLGTLERNRQNLGDIPFSKRPYFRDCLDAGLHILSDGREIYERDVGSLPLDRNEKNNLARKDVEGTLRGALSGAVTGVIGAGAGVVIGAATGAIVGAVSSSGTELASWLFDKLHRIFRKKP